MNAGRWTSAFSREAVSKHLVVLQRAGLVSRRKQGREALYQVEASDSPDAWVNKWDGQGGMRYTTVTCVAASRRSAAPPASRPAGR